MSAPDPSRVLVTSDDPRLSDARPPSTHTHTPESLGAVANAGGADGLWVGTTANLPATGTAGVLYVTYE